MKWLMREDLFTDMPNCMLVVNTKICNKCSEKKAHIHFNKRVVMVDESRIKNGEIGVMIMNGEIIMEGNKI